MLKNNLIKTDSKTISNFLTFDVEEWFDAEIPRRKLTFVPDECTAIEKQTDLFIDICKRLNIKSTCFVVGKVAQKKPQIVKKLYGNGHEIASHSYSHNLIYNMTPEIFRRDLRQSIEIVENITGEKIKGFRAPSFSINSGIANWFYKILEEENIVYSSSVYPAKTFLYGMPESPPNIHKVKDNSVIEIPLQLLNIGILKTGVTGGTYLRVFPKWLIKRFIINKNKNGKNIFIYIHPWELLYQRYPVNLSLSESIIQYWGIRRNLSKIENLCTQLKGTFKRIDQFVEELNLI
jgi:polysaccharide deacetylase family protein (PEP-CTERM system associated)